MAQMIRKQVYLEPRQDRMVAAGRKALAFMRSLAERGQRSSRRTWDRDSLYADRIDRWKKS
jgi:hypothetical protein